LRGLEPEGSGREMCTKNGAPLSIGQQEGGEGE